MVLMIIVMARLMRIMYVLAALIMMEIIIILMGDHAVLLTVMMTMLQ